MSARGAAPAQAAYVLHRYDWSESSLIVELFTRDAGRVVVAAKGAKRPTSQLRAVLMPFQRITVAVRAQPRRRRRSEVRTLRSAEWGGGAPLARRRGLFAGFYLNELLLRLLARDDAHPRLWDAYAATLAASARRPTKSALRAFELLLLRETGVLPDLHRTTLTQAVGASRPALRACAPKPGLAEAAGDDALAARTAWRWLPRCSAALAAGATSPACEQACAPDQPPLRRQLRAQLHYHLGGAPLRTRQVMLDLQRLLEAGPSNR